MSTIYPPVKSIIKGKKIENLHIKKRNILCNKKLNFINLKIKAAQKQKIYSTLVKNIQFWFKIFNFS